VGLYSGDDTHFYLTQGFRVLAIDASPRAIMDAKVRFGTEFNAGALTLLHAAISPSDGPCPLWICDDFEMWNSCDRAIAARNGLAHHSIEVPGKRFREVLEEYGVPHYLKVDIEGSDHLCLGDLLNNEPPRFISVEAECCGSEVPLSEREYLRNLCLLHEAGYQRFKLIDQETLAAVSSGETYTPDWWRKRAGVRGLLEQTFDCAFPVGSTGPWGEAASGEWMEFARALETYCAWRAAFFALKGRATFSFWYDWHASLGE